MKLKSLIKEARTYNILKYKNAKNLYDKTIAQWRREFRKMTNQQLQAFMEEIAYFSKDYLK